MPLLHKKPFVRKRPPAGVMPTDKVFYCELTNEAFSDYDEYWERLVLCNAMVWTCELTGRPNLTYQEALDSEAKGFKFVSSISPFLKKPLLYLTSLTRRGRQTDLSDDVFNHCRDRYFPGEPVEAIVNKHWYDCKVVRVITPTAEEVARYEEEMADSEDEVEAVTKDGAAAGGLKDHKRASQDGSSSQPITLDDDDDDIEVLTPAAPQSTLTKGSIIPAKKASSPQKGDEDYPPYATYKYEVEEELAWDYKTCKRHIVSWEQIRRSKNALTREKCKLFLKICTELSPRGFWMLKSSVAKKYAISSLSYRDLFPGNQPRFTESLSKKMPLALSPRGKEAQEKLHKKENKQSQLRDKKEAREEKRLSKGGSADDKKRGRPSLSEHEKLTRKLERIKSKQLELTNAMKSASGAKSAAGTQVTSVTVASKAAPQYNKEEQQRLILQRQEHFAQMKEILKQKLEREKAEKKQERDVKKEARRLMALEVKDWLKPREDLLCGDHKPLPSAAPVECGVPNHLFGDFLALLEFLNSFADVLELNDVYPHGISFEMLENAVVTKEVAGVFNDVVQLLLGAVFSLQEEEDEEITADTTVDPSMGLSLNCSSNDHREAAVELANRASQWSTQQQNTTLHQLPLDALTLTEVLRLHLLAAGADNNHNAQWRHMNRGGYKHWDDPGLQFKLDEPEVVKTLAVKSIFDMHIEDKMKVLHVLMHQILTYAGVRDRLEEAFDKIRVVKAALRDQQNLYRQREREEHQARVLKKKEDRLKSSNQLKKKVQGGTGAASEPAAEQEELQEPEEEEEPEDAEEKKEREEKEEKNKERRKQEHSKKEIELLEQIMTLSAKANPVPLGEDRAYRRYWVFNSVPGLFVEDDEPHKGTCYDTATKDVDDVWPESCSVTKARLNREARELMFPESLKEESVEEKANTSDKENDTSALASPAKVNGATSSPSSSSSVAATIAKVISSPVVSSNTSAKKLLKPSTNIVLNGPVKGVQKSAKDQNITKFFTKSPKCENVKSNGVVSMKSVVDLTPKKEPSSSATDRSPLKRSSVEGDTKERLKDEPEEVMVVEETKAPVEVFGLCTADPLTCPVHTTDSKRTKWSFYYKEEDINALIDGLNERGEREGALKENLIMFRAKIESNVKNCPVYLLNPTEDCEQDTAVRKSKRYGGKKGGDSDTNLNFPLGTPIDHILELTLRDMILEVEEKLYVGLLGKLQVSDRDQWRACLTKEGKLHFNMDSLDWGGRKRIAQFKSELGLETSSVMEEVTEQQEEQRNSTVHMLAVALLQVSQSVDTKYIKPPLAESEKQKQKRLKAERKLRRLVEKRDRDRDNKEQQQENGTNNSDDSDSDSESGDSAQLQSVSDTSLRMPLERWEASLMTCVSFSQIFLHLATLDNSVTWSRSLTKTRCRVCRKGGDHDKMLLCDGCDKGHHIYCLKPKLKNIPDGDWFCDKCKPKEKAKSPKKIRRIYVEEEEEDEEEEEEDDEEEQEEVAEEVQEEDEEEVFEDDYCDVCSVGGKLICCDGCPRTFHPECVQLKKIPRGSWNCPHCNKSPVAEKDKAKKSKTEEKIAASKKSEDKSKKSDTGSKKRKSVADSQTTPVTSSRSKRSSPDEDDEEDEVVVPQSKRRRTDDNYAKANGTADSSRSSSRRSLVDTEDIHPSVLHKILSELIAHEDAWPFLKPVNKKLVPDYYQVVKKPMDLQSMRDKLNNVQYNCDAEFIADGLLVFQNCQQYNMEDTDEYKLGEKLGKLFKKRALDLGLHIDSDAQNGPVNKSSSKAKKTTAGTKRKRQSL